MSSGYSANQYENAFNSQKLQNWTLPKHFKERPSAAEGHTIFIASDRGHLLPGVKAKRGSAWPGFKGTWELPARLPPASINPTARSEEGRQRLTHTYTNSRLDIHTHRAAKTTTNPAADGQTEEDQTCNAPTSERPVTGQSGPGERPLNQASERASSHPDTQQEERSAVRGNTSAGEGSAVRGNTSAGERSAVRGNTSAGEGSAVRGNTSAGERSAVRGNTSAGERSAARGNTSAGERSAVRGNTSAGERSAVRGNTSAGERSAVRGNTSAGERSAARENTSAGERSAVRENTSAGERSVSQRERKPSSAAQ